MFKRTKVDIQPNLTQLLVLGLGIHGIGFFKKVWKVKSCIDMSPYLSPFRNLEEEKKYIYIYIYIYIIIGNSIGKEFEQDLVTITIKA